MAATAPYMTLREAREALGVEPAASPAELRRAFREAAKRAHPDREGGDPAVFLRVTEAYRRLQESQRLAERIIQPPACSERVGETLSISPLQALNGGAIEHRLASGRTLRIQLPAGLRAGDTVRAGEAELPVRVEGAPELMVRGDDLWMTVAVDPRMLTEGGRLAVETPLGRRIVWVTKRAGERGLVRLEGQGLPARGRHGRGHLFLRLAAKRGEAASAARALLRRFAAAWAA